MNNNYTRELEDLKKIYNKTLEDLTPKHANKFKQLMNVMREYMAVDDLKNLYERKLQILECKMQTDSHCDDEENKDWFSQSNHGCPCCEEDDE